VRVRDGPPDIAANNLASHEPLLVDGYYADSTFPCKTLVYLCRAAER
jgi:hypothetical protein